MTRLAIFDLDGTLTRTNAVDGECYLEAMSTELGCALNPDWTTYQHCTDAGIAHEALADFFGRRATSEEIDRLRERFVALLEARMTEDPSRFSAIPGAIALLSRLQEEGWHLCIATGGWSISAELKRRAAFLTRCPSSLRISTTPGKGSLRLPSAACGTSTASLVRSRRQPGRRHLGRVGRRRPAPAVRGSRPRRAGGPSPRGGGPGRAERLRRPCSHPGDDRVRRGALRAGEGQASQPPVWKLTVNTYQTATGLPSRVAGLNVQAFTASMAASVSP